MAGMLFTVCFDWERTEGFCDSGLQYCSGADKATKIHWSHIPKLFFASFTDIRMRNYWHLTSRYQHNSTRLDGHAMLVYGLHLWFWKESHALLPIICKSLGYVSSLCSETSEREVLLLVKAVQVRAETFANADGLILAFARHGSSRISGHP